MDADVIVVGGAVAGGALANALGSAGVRTLLIEKVSREVHSTRGDTLHPPTLSILERWGVRGASWGGDPAALAGTRPNA